MTTENLQLSKRYKITVEEIGQETGVRGHEWMKGAGENGEWGYTPQTMAVKSYTRTIYEQSVDDLDMEAVIRAVNGIL